MMLAARFKQCALMPLAASPFVDPGRILVITLFLYLLVFRSTPLLLALVGSSDLVHLGTCGKLLKKSEGDKRLMYWGLDEYIT